MMLVCYFANLSVCCRMFSAKDLSDMVTSLTFRGVRDSFQCRWNEDIRKKKSSPYVFVSA